MPSHITGVSVSDEKAEADQLAKNLHWFPYNHKPPVLLPDSQSLCYMSVFFHILVKMNGSRGMPLSPIIWCIPGILVTQDKSAVYA